MIKINHRGNFNKVEKFISRMEKRGYLNIFKKYAQEGVEALSSATPIDSGNTQESWGYNITFSSKGLKITWTNSHIVNGVSIAIIIQYGHGTKNGGYVQGRDYINPAIQPVFDRITQDMWREVIKT